MMSVTTLADIIEPLKNKKKFYADHFGVTRFGIFGSFVEGMQTADSDIDIVVEMRPDKKNLHNFLQLKRLLEEEFNRSVDLGLEHTLKPMIRERLKDKIVYV